MGMLEQTRAIAVGSNAHLTAEQLTGVWETAQFSEVKTMSARAAGARAISLPVPLSP
jgi:hypothetical protein